jgi:cell division protein FtsQ
LVNTEGEPFKRVQATEPIDLPLLTGVDRDDFVSHRDDSLAAVRQTLRVVDSYSRSVASKGHSLSEAHVDESGVTLITDSGEEIRLGEGGVPEKIERLERIRRELATRQMSAERIRLDNRARPNWVTVQPRLQAAPSATSEKSKRPGN